MVAVTSRLTVAVTADIAALRADVRQLRDRVAALKARHCRLTPSR